MLPTITDLQLGNKLSEETRSLTGCLWESSSGQILLSCIYERLDMKAGCRLGNHHNCNDKMSIQGVSVYSVHTISAA